MKQKAQQKQPQARIRGSKQRQAQPDDRNKVKEDDDYVEDVDIKDDEMPFI